MQKASEQTTTVFVGVWLDVVLLLYFPPSRLANDKLWKKTYRFSLASHWHIWSIWCQEVHVWVSVLSLITKAACGWQKCHQLIISIPALLTLWSTSTGFLTNNTSLLNCSAAWATASNNEGACHQWWKLYWDLSDLLPKWKKKRQRCLTM